jgi:CheY-like chemotaxis protein
MADLLIVDDDGDVADVLGELLGGEGHSIRIAHDGLEGIGRLKEGLPDAILLDVDMPRLTGPEMAYRLFLRDAGEEKIPIVLLSGKIDLPRVADAVGTPYFLCKPYDWARLLALLDRVLVERTPPHPEPSVAASARG